jgi:hypothetical protein
MAGGPARAERKSQENISSVGFEHCELIAQALKTDTVDQDQHRFDIT